MLRPFLALTAALLLAPAFAAQPKGSGFPGPNPRPDAPKALEPAPAPAEAAPATPAAPAAPSGMLLDRVVAIANDGIVMQSELDEQMDMITARLQQQNTPLPPPDVLRRQVLERLVMQELQLQRAERVGIKVSDEQVNAALSDDAQRNGLTLQQLPAALAREGIDYATYRDNMRKEITLVLLRRREVRINVTPRELDQFIERMKKLPGENDEYNISHILIAVPADSNQAQSDELAKKAEEVYERAKTEDFGRLAIAFSNSQTALEGGALGWRKGPELPTLLAETIVGLKPGEVSRPLSAPNGFHIVKLNDVRGTTGNPIQDQVHARHILMRPNALQDDATVRQKLAGIREKVLAGEDFAAFASSLSEDSGSAVQGGDLGWSGPGSFVPEFEAELAKLQDNEMSEPFHSQFGWHLVQVLGRRQFDTTEDTLRDRAFAQLRESKIDEETEVWLRRMRDESFVNLDP